jgi:hypothetical protein
MAVARPGPSDARVPCPLCGGLIHPIAGKCKHCKADLAAHRAVRPAASAPLPALHRAPSNGHPAGAPASQGVAERDPQRTSPRDRSVGSNGHAAQAHAPAHAPVAATEPPVLPPRPSRSGTGTGWAEPTPSSWRSWPVLVIALAMMAIIAAVVLMVWPTGGARSDARSLQPPPAPEHMPTDPAIKVPPLDRRTITPPPIVPDPQPPSAVPPGPQAAPQDPAALDNQADEDDDLPALKNPYANPHGGPSQRLRRPGTMMAVMLSHVCKKLTECHAADATTADLCERIGGLPAVVPANCPAAARCLDHIDSMSCGTPPTSLGQLGAFMTQFRDCADAARC